MPLAEAVPLNTSARWRTALLVIGATLTVIGFVSWTVTPRDWVVGPGDGVSPPSVAGYLAASLFVAATGMVSAALIAHGRLYAGIVAKRMEEFEEWEAAGKPDARGWVLPTPDAWTPEILTGWPQALVSILIGGLALAAVINCWSLGNQPAARLQTQQVYGGLTWTTLRAEPAAGNPFVSQVTGGFQPGSTSDIFQRRRREGLDRPMR